MHPIADAKGAVVQQLVCISAVSAVGRFVECLLHREITDECREFDEIGSRPFELHLQCVIIHCANPQITGWTFAAINGFGILDGVQDKGVFRCRAWSYDGSPGKDKVMGGHRVTVTPLSVFSQPKGRLFVINLPPGCDAWRQVAAPVVTR